MIFDKKMTADKSKIDKIIALPKVKSKVAESNRKQKTKAKAKNPKLQSDRVFQM